MKLKIKQKFWDFLWWNFGIYFWRKSAGLHLEKEVKRRLGWMRLDCLENCHTNIFEYNKRNGNYNTPKLVIKPPPLNTDNWFGETH